MIIMLYKEKLRA